MALDDIRISLQLLAESVETLEKDIEAQEKASKAAPAKKTAQIDMFGWAPPRASNDKNNAILAKKLDSTIDKIQNLLREGAA